MMDEDDENKECGPKAKTFGKVLKESYSEYGSSSPSPVTPTSVLPELMNGSPKSSYSSSLLLPLRVQAVGKSNPVDVKRLGSDMLPKVQVHVQNSLNQKKVAAVEKQKKEAKGNSPVRKTSEVPHLNSSNASGDKAKSSLNVALPSSPLGRLHSELLKDKVGAEKSTLTSPSPLSASLLPSPSPSASQLSSPLSTSLLPSPSPSASQLPSPLSTTLLPSPSPSASPLPSPSASQLPSPSPLSETPSADVLLPSPQSQRVKMSMDMETDIRLLPPPPKPSAEVLLAPLPSLPTKLSTDKAVDIRAFAPSAPPTAASALAPPLLQQNVVSGGPPLPSPPMLQRNAEAVQATKVATESQLPSPLSMLTNITVAGIPLPRPPSPPPPVSSKPNVMAIGAPLLPPPPVLLQSKVVATGAPLPPPPPPPPPGTVSTMPSRQPPMILSKGSGPLLPPPPSPPMSNGGAAPPPSPHGAAKSLRPKKANTKLKGSSHIGNLYRVWRGKIEECPKQGKSPTGTKTGVGTIIINGKQGISDALAEMNKRSDYFQQIEEDVDKHAKSITELKTAVNTFNTKDMTKLLKFHKHLESILENLTDETQVLTRFEGFPTKKLEALRTASGLYLKLESMITVLQNWKIEPPLAELLNKVDRYFNKIKGEIVVLERTKDELTKKFKSQDIDFDFQILVQIKEAMVDVSSNCMELAMKERREVKLRENEVSKAKAEAQRKVCIKMLWRAFQLAFRVYTFAGLSHDDRADQLTPELADESQIDPQ